MLFWGSKYQLLNCKEVKKAINDGDNDPLLMSRLSDFHSQVVNPRHFIAIESEAFGRFCLEPTDLVYCAHQGKFVQASKLSLDSVMQVHLPPLKWPKRTTALQASERILEILTQLRELLELELVHAEWPYDLAYELVELLNEFPRFSERASRRIWYALIETFAEADADTRKAEKIIRFSSKRFRGAAPKICKLVQFIGFRLGYITRYAYFNGTHCLDTARHYMTTIDHEVREVYSGVTSLTQYRPKRRSECYYFQSDYLFTTAGTLLLT